MRLPLFGWYLVVGACCSLAAIALHQPFAITLATGQPLIQASAPTPEPWEPAPSPTPTVTQPTPTEQPTEAEETDEPVESDAAQHETLDRPPEAVTPEVAEAAGALDEPNIEPAPTRVAIRRLPSGMTPRTILLPDAHKESDLLDLLNGARLEDGQAIFERDAELDAVAFTRAKQLIEDGYFDHYGPDGASAFSELAARGIEYTLAGENLARNNYPSARTVDAAYRGLMASPGHRANILEPAFGEIGLAAVQSDRMWYYVMVFTNPR